MYKCCGLIFFFWFIFFKPVEIFQTGLKFFKPDRNFRTSLLLFFLVIYLLSVKEGISFYIPLSSWFLSQLLYPFPQIPINYEY